MKLGETGLSKNGTTICMSSNQKTTKAYTAASRNLHGALLRQTDQCTLYSTCD